MITVLSPAKKLNFEEPALTAQSSVPVFMHEADMLMAQLKGYQVSDLQKLMGVSEKIAQLNIVRNQEWGESFNPDKAKQALLAFQGDVYVGLEAGSFTEEDFSFAQNHLRILSGLYGLLRPLDLMQAYRLEMGTRIVNTKGANLYAFWGSQITEALNLELTSQKSQYLINLASNEYFKAIKPKDLQAEIITPVFMDWKNGKYKIISFFAKKARGMMAQHIIKHRLSNPADLQTFSMGGYGFKSGLSVDNKWVFTRKQSA